MSKLRLRQVASVNPPTPEFDRLAGDDEVSFVPLERVWPGRFDPSELRPKAAVANGYTRFRDGDIIVPKITPTFQADRTLIASGLHGGVAAGTTELHVIRPLKGTEPRYIRYLLSTRPFLHGGASEMIGVAGQKRVPDTWLRDTEVPLFDPAQQQRIADFLDVETSRIDALITAKQQMIRLLDERRWLAVASEIDTGDYPAVPLRRALVGITDGPFGSAFSSSDYSHEGVAVVRLGNIGFADWRSGELAYLPTDRFGEFRRHRVSQGDLLIAGLGDDRNHAGRACVAPDLGLAIVKGKCFCARVDPTRAVADYLAIFCSSPAGADAISVEARGSTRSMINLDIVKTVVVPLPDLARQVEIVDKVRAVWEVQSRGRVALLTQIEVLRERRQALITAAVSGELTV